MITNVQIGAGEQIGKSPGKSCEVRLGLVLSRWAAVLLTAGQSERANIDAAL